MAIQPDGINAAAEQEQYFHPTRKDGKIITAWKRRAATINALVAEVNRLTQEVEALKQGNPNPQPEPEPEPSKRYAPRAYNSTASADARFCCTPEYGCKPAGQGWIDQMGILYDESMRDLGGRTNNTNNPIPELKGANSMDGKEPCEEYVGPTGRTIGGASGYPAASFER